MAFLFLVGIFCPWDPAPLSLASRQRRYCCAVPLGFHHAARYGHADLRKIGGAVSKLGLQVFAVVGDSQANGGGTTEAQLDIDYMMGILDLGLIDFAIHFLAVASPPCRRHTL